MDEGQDDHDDEDLYGDMGDIKPAPTSQRHHPGSLTDRVEELEQLTKRLRRENATLKRNIGTLYRTAAAELHRKEQQIRELRERRPNSSG